MERIPNLKAIPTKYNGIKFRSRLEARWAIFMDNIGVKYEYEPEGFDLEGLWYLPDFWLPTFDGGSFMEVKPTDLNDGEMEKVKRLARIGKKNVILAVGVPDLKCLQVISYPDHSGKEDYWIWHGLMNADQAVGEDRMFALPGYESADLTISPLYYNCLGEQFIQAVIKAKEVAF